MENLAGNRKCDQQIYQELTQAGVEVLSLPARLQSEVPASMIGHLPGFVFSRAWYYWVVKGDVPLEVAKELYEDPRGQKDVRVMGHCGCPSPEEWALHYDSEGKRLGTLKDEKELLKWERATRKNFSEQEGSVKNKKEFEELIQEVKASNRYVEDPQKEAARSIVNLYHIDSQEGLNLFVATLRKHGIVPSEENRKQ